MRLSSFLIALIVVTCNGALWVYANLPVSAGAIRYPVTGLSYNPYQRDQSPFRNDLPRREGIIRDLDLLSSRTRSIRLYNTRGLEDLPSLAQERNLAIIGSAWLGSDPVENAKEVAAAISLTGRHREIRRLIIGNETQLKKTVPREELVGYLREARRRLRTPVSTAEPWDIWLNDPALANEVDFITIHILPYWMEVPIEEAVDYVIGKYEAVRAAFPGRVIIIGEAGWPSDGPQRGAAEASVANQARFVREFVARAERQAIIYNLIEAFDQPWKSALEGRAGEHFGIMDAERMEKFPLEGLVLEDPTWELWTVVSVVVGLIVILLYFARRPEIGFRARLFAAVLLQAAITTAVQLAREASSEYMSAGDIIFWGCMLAAQAILAVVFLTDTSEIADVVGRRPLRRVFPPLPPGTSSELPFVSIHVAACREPPQLLIATLDSLARLDYPNFEVIVVDNNTPDETLWRPVEAHCRTLGERFRFFTLGKWPGFKAGALNYALKATDPRASIIGVIDADYVVDPQWLSATVPYFQDPNVALVQAPQEHRDFQQSLFQRMENDEYAGFFRIGMVQRNEDNAIIQHGTMTLIHRHLLDQLSGWAEWCICEDAELGLRILLQGRRSVYVNHPLGFGLVPDSYEAFSKQRFRWAYGGMRIFRRYWREIFGLRRGLSRAQRYQFLKGWLPWVGDALHGFFTFAALLWTGLLVAEPLHTDFPEPIFIYPAVALVLLRIFGTAWTYAVRVRIGLVRTITAMVAGGALTHTIAKGVFLGLCTSRAPFHRTPKLANAPRFLQSLLSAWQETSLALLLWSGAGAILLIFGTDGSDAILWSLALVGQSLPYLAALTASIISGFQTRRG